MDLSDGAAIDGEEFSDREDEGVKGTTKKKRDGEPRKKRAERFVWSPDTTRALIDVKGKYEQERSAPEGRWRKHTDWEVVLELFAEVTGVTLNREQVKNKWGTLQRDWDDWRFILSIADGRDVVDLGEEDWDRILEKQARLRKWRFTHFEFWDEMEEYFGRFGTAKKRRVDADSSAQASTRGQSRPSSSAAEERVAIPSKRTRESGADTRSSKRAKLAKEQEEAAPDGNESDEAVSAPESLPVRKKRGRPRKEDRNKADTGTPAPVGGGRATLGPPRTPQGVSLDGRYADSPYKRATNVLLPMCDALPAESKKKILRAFRLSDKTSQQFVETPESLRELFIEDVLENPQ